MTIDLKKHRLRIYKLTLHLLDDPEYIQFLIHPQLRKLAIRRCEEKDIQSQKIYWTMLSDKRYCCEFYSKPLISRLRPLLDAGYEDHTFKMIGYKNNENDRVLFDLLKAKIINEEVEAESICNNKQKISAN